jgi:phosphoglycolate phosphatase-like HAD superfamily hydrolase
MKPLYIFDLDGTLADCSHRLPYITGEKKDWRAFFAACVDDKPIEPAIRTLKALTRSAEVWIWTGRSDEVRGETVKWLHDHVGVFHSFWNPMRAPEALTMRAAGDHTPDHKLKYGWLADLEPPERNRLTAVFEDRSSVVQMWRDAGVPCFQVAAGDF